MKRCPTEPVQPRTPRWAGRQRRRLSVRRRVLLRGRGPAGTERDVPHFLMGVFAAMVSDLGAHSGRAGNGVDGSEVWTQRRQKKSKSAFPRATPPHLGGAPPLRRLRGFLLDTERKVLVVVDA